MPAPGSSVSEQHNIPFFNITAPDFDFCSPEMFAAQAEGWYADSPLGPLVLRYEEAAALLRDRRMDHNGKLYMESNGVTGGPLYDWYVPMIVNHDGPDHRRLRGLVSKAFTPRMIENVRPFIQEAAQRLAGKLAEGAECEFVADFGNRLPLAVMCHLLGVPPADYDRFRGWTADLGLVFSIAYGEEIRARAEAAVVGLSGYVDTLMNEKKARPGDDLMSTLVTLQAADGEVSTEELRNLLVTLVFAAHDTTRDQLGNAMVAFASHPAQWGRLRLDPGLAPQAVEEVMRWCPSAQAVFRFAAADFEYHGLCLSKNDQVTMCVPTAQRDPRAFRDPRRFDITVKREGQPLQFGAGPHHCLGAALARAEVSEALTALSARFGPPELAGPVDWRMPLGIFGPDRLPLRFGTLAGA
jgi:cytochrome P450